MIFAASSSKIIFQLRFASVIPTNNDLIIASSEKGHGVQALACRIGPLENGSHKLKLELHAFFHSFRASQRHM